MTWQQKLENLGKHKSVILSLKNIDSMLKGEELFLVISQILSSVSRIPLKRASILIDPLLSFIQSKTNIILDRINEIPFEFEDRWFAKLFKFLGEITAFCVKSKKYFIPSFWVLFFFIFVSTFPFDYKDNIVTWFGFTVGINREVAIGKQLHSLVIIAWFFLIIYLLSFLFYPLGKSFLLSHQLWLRLSKCKPYEVAISRAIWVLSYASSLGVLVSLWAIGSSIFNQISLGEFLWEVMAVFSYIVFAGGIITFSLTFINISLKIPVIDPIISILVSVLAWISFIFFILIYGIFFLPHPEYRWLKFFPLFAPMSIMKSLGNYGIHLGITTIIGIVLLGLSVAIPWISHRDELESS